MAKLSNIKIGDLVVVGRWRDFDLMDAVQLGEFREYKDGYFYISVAGVPVLRSWQHCRVVEKRLIRKPHLTKHTPDRMESGEKI